MKSTRRRRNLLVALGATAAGLTAAALFNRYKAEQAERRMPPLGRFIDVDGTRLHYVDRGKGQPVVMLHGNGAMIQDMIVSGVVFSAAEKYRVIAFDRPGFGYSDRPRSTVWTPHAQAQLLHRALVQLGIERPIIVGHSWGTLVALSLALDFPQDIASLVLLSGYYYPTPRMDVVISLPSATPIVGDILSNTISPMMGRVMTPSVFKKLFAPSPITKRFSGFPVEMALRPSQLKAAAADTALMVPAAAALSSRYHELNLPVIILAGDADKIADFDQQSARLHGDILGSVLVRVPDAGHMIHHIAPDQVLSAIDQAASHV